MDEYKKIELSGLNSFGVNAIADRLVEVYSVEELHKLFLQGTLLDSKWDVLGGGNNVLFVGNYPGTLIKPTMAQIETLSDEGQTVEVKAGAGVEWDDLVAWCVERELWGLENMSLIPGKVGAAPVQNIGSYGVEVKDVIVNVEGYCPETDAVRVLAGEECEFGYRDSIFKRQMKGRVIITAVTVRLSRVPCPKLHYGHLEREVLRLGGVTLANIRRAVIGIRESKLPDTKVTGNAGSFFKNPVVELSFANVLRERYLDMPLYPCPEGRVKLAAGWIIDQAGWRGYRGERVGVHPEQALVLINLGGASGADVMALADMIVADVKNKFGIDLEKEVNILP